MVGREERFSRFESCYFRRMRRKRFAHRALFPCIERRVVRQADRSIRWRTEASQNLIAAQKRRIRIQQSDRSFPVIAAGDSWFDVVRNCPVAVIKLRIHRAARDFRIVRRGNTGDAPARCCVCMRCQYCKLRSYADGDGH